MNTVRSIPLRDASAGGCISTVGVVFLAVSIGPLLWLLNGGYSIQGMAWLAETAGAYGKLFWSVATIWAIDIPIAAKAGLPLSQPIIPWLFVGGISFLEIGLFIRRLRRDSSEALLDACGNTASGFDYVTTAIGLVYAPFTGSLFLILHAFWAILAIALAVPLTFGFEALLARALRGRRNHVRPHHTEPMGPRSNG